MRDFLEKGPEDGKGLKKGKRKGMMESKRPAAGMARTMCLVWAGNGSGGRRKGWTVLM